MYANRFFKFGVILAFVAVIALTIREAVATSATALDPGAQEAQRLQRSRAAEAARWTAMGEYYEKLNGSQRIMRSRTADAARWTAMGDYYEKEESQIQRSRAVEAARWTAIGEYYKKLEAAQIQRSRAADTARWNAMAEYYRLKNLATP